MLHVVAAMGRLTPATFAFATCALVHCACSGSGTRGADAGHNGGTTPVGAMESCRRLESQPGQFVCIQSESIFSDEPGVGLQSGLPESNLPTTVSHRVEYLDQWAPEISDQGECAWCVAHAVTQAIEALVARDGTMATPVSEPHLWSLGDKDVAHCDGGWKIDSALAVARANRLVPNATWPYSGLGGLPTKVPQIPINVLDRESQFQIEDYYGVEKSSVIGLKKVLSGGYNVVYGLPIFRRAGWDKYVSGPAWKDGDIDLRASTQGDPSCSAKTSPAEISTCKCSSSTDCPDLAPLCARGRCSEGLHAVLIVGYTDADGGWFEFRNSWGSKWGRGGYGRISYGHLTAFGLGGAYPTSLAACRPHDEWKCSSGDIHWFDSCGKSEGIHTKCAAGCAGDLPYCNGATCEDDHSSLGCFKGDVFWLDSCGNPTTVGQACGPGQSCDAGVCTCVPNCGGRDCGGDGCGGSCGDCTAAGLVCDSGKCVVDSTFCKALCNGHGSCSTGAQGMTCDCHVGYSGSTCETCYSGFGPYPTCLPLPKYINNDFGPSNDSTARVTSAPLPDGGFAVAWLGISKNPDTTPFPLEDVAWHAACFDQTGAFVSGHADFGGSRSLSALSGGGLVLGGHAGSGCTNTGTGKFPIWKCVDTVVTFVRLSSACELLWTQGYVLGGLPSAGPWNGSNGQVAGTANGEFAYALPGLSGVNVVFCDTESPPKCTIHDVDLGANLNGFAFEALSPLTGGAMLLLEYQVGPEPQISSWTLLSDGTIAASKVPITGGNGGSYARLAARADGGVWAQWVEDKSSALYARRASGKGESVGGTVSVFSALSPAINNHDIAVLSNDTFVSAWYKADYAQKSWGVYFQRYSSTGTKLGIPVEVSTLQTPAGLLVDLTVVATSDGGFVVVYMGDYLPTIDRYPLYMQRYDAVGQVKAVTN